MTHLEIRGSHINHQSEEKHSIFYFNVVLSTSLLLKKPEIPEDART